MLKAVAVIALTLLAYAPVSQSPFLYEDTQTLAAKEAALPTWADLAPGRYVTGLTISADWRAGNGTTTAFHRTNLLLHLLNGGLVWALARRLNLGHAAWIAGAIFLLHPLNTQAVSYISGRPDLLATAGVLLACLAVRVPMTWPSVVGVIVAGWIALMTKQSAVAVVALVPLVAWAQGARVPPWSVLVLGAVAACGLPVAVAINANADLEPVRYVAAQSLAVWTYLGLSVIPIGLSIEHDVIAAPALLHLLALEASIVAIWLAWRYRTAVPALAFAVGWIVCAVAPRLVVRMPDALAEHQWYLAFVGVSLVAASALSQSGLVQES